MFKKILRSSRSVYPGIIGALWCELFNGFGILLFIAGYILDDSTVADTAVAVATFGSLSGEDVALIGMGISIIITTLSFLAGFFWFLVWKKVVLIGDNPYGAQKMVWTIVYLAGSLAIPGCFVGWILMMEYYHFKKVLKRTTGASRAIPQINSAQQYLQKSRPGVPANDNEEITENERRAA